jgi:hypothetical protein
MRLFSMFPAIAGAKIRAQHARERAKEVIREADRAEAEVDPDGRLRRTGAAFADDN